MRPAEEWAPTFTQFFSDDEVVRVTYAISQFSDGAYCKLCDAWVEGSLTEHVESHARDLAEWRKRQNEVRAEARAEALRRAREERATTKVTTIEPSNPTKKQLLSRVRNARWKLAHPERYKRDAWTKAEREEMEKTIAEATAKLNTKETT